MAAVAKINAPQLRDAYARERLYALLDAAGPPAALWICAPPGAGKTTLAASWIAARSLEPLWYRVDEGDADPATLFYYLGLAASQAAPRRRKPMPLFSADYALGLPAFSRNYFRQLYQRLPARSVLVFDNFQDAGIDVPLHEIVQVAVDELPAGVCLVIVSRSMPPPALTRRVTYGALRVVGPEAMRLSRDEVAGIAARQRRAPADPAALDRLAEQAQGWAAGLVLLCATDGVAGPALPQQASSLQAVFDYFAGEILRKVDRQTQDVLLTTALLPMTSADTAVRLTGQLGAAVVLEKLYEYNYFTLRDEQAEPVYHYHPLFRTFLLTQAEKTYTGEHIAKLRRRAAALLEEKGQPEAAFELWRAAQDWEAASSLLLRSADAMLEQGRQAIVAGWFDGFPAARVHEDAWLLTVRGHARMLITPGESIEDFERAYALFLGRDDGDGAYAALSGAMLAIIADHAGDAARFDPWLDRLDSLFARFPKCGNAVTEAAVMGCAYLALWYRAPNDDRAASWGERALQLAHAAGDMRWVMMANHCAGLHGLLRGEYARAGRAIEMFTSSEWRRQVRDPRHISLVPHLLIYYYWSVGEFEAAERALHDGIAFTDETGAKLWRYQVLVQSAELMIYLGRLDEAESFLSRMRESVSVASGFPAVHYHFVRAFLHLLRGDLPRARADAERAMVLLPTSNVVIFEPVAPLTLACVMMFQGDTAAARVMLSDALAAAKRIGSRNLEQMCRLTEASIAFRSGHDADGRAALAEALALGRDERYVTIGLHLDENARLCARALEAGIEPDYVRHIIRKLRLLAPSPDIEAWPWPLKVFTLGRFALLKDDQPIEFGHKAPKKLVALLKAIVALGGHDVSEQRLGDALWPDLDADAAREALKTALHRLDKLLGAGVVGNQGGRVALDAQRVWVDAWAFERALAKGEAAETAAQRRAASDAALTLYRGPFLAADETEPWALSLRERLRARFIRHLTALGRDHAAAGEHDAAAASYLRGLEVDDLAEELYRAAMHSYAQAGRHVEALAVYRRLRKVLSLSLGIAPSDATEKLYRSLLA